MTIDVIAMARKAGIMMENSAAIRAAGLFSELVAAAVAKDYEERLKWDIHSCSPTCSRYVCVATREAFAAAGEAVQAEREACEALYEHEDVLAPVGASAWGEAYQEGWIAGAQAYRDAIRARGSNT